MKLDYLAFKRDNLMGLALLGTVPMDFLAADMKSGFFEIAHGDLDCRLLDEVRCNQLRLTRRGNPHKRMIANP